MRRLFPALAAVVLSSSPVAYSQIVSVYGTFSDTHLSGLVNGSAGNVIAGYSPTTTSHWAPGFGLGATFGVLPIGPVHLGLDLRGSLKPGNNGFDLILAGPRLALKLPIISIKPYLQASGGYLRTRTSLMNSPLPAGTQNTATFGAYEILGGVDYGLAPFLDFRVIEVGGGKGYSLNTIGSDSGYTVSLFTVSTGVVFHL